MHQVSQPVVNCIDIEDDEPDMQEVDFEGSQSQPPNLEGSQMDPLQDSQSQPPDVLEVNLEGSQMDLQDSQSQPHNFFGLDLADSHDPTAEASQMQDISDDDDDSPPGKPVSEPPLASQDHQHQALQPLDEETLNQLNDADRAFEESVDAIAAAGWTEEQALEALRISGDDLMKALEYLIQRQADQEVQRHRDEVIAQAMELDFFKGNDSQVDLDKYTTEELQSIIAEAANSPAIDTMQTVPIEIEVVDDLNGEGHPAAAGEDIFFMPHVDGDSDHDLPDTERVSWSTLESPGDPEEAAQETTIVMICYPSLHTSLSN